MPAPVGVLADDLARVRVVGGDDDQRVGVAALVVQGDADRLVERDRLADLAARVGGVVLLVDRGALDLQEEALVGSSSSSIAFVVIAAQARLVRRTLVGLACTAPGVALAERGRRAGPLQSSCCPR